MSHLVAQRATSVTKRFGLCVEKLGRLLAIKCVRYICITPEQPRIVRNYQ